MNETGKTDVEMAYDSMPYTAVSCRESHPAFLETVARLFGFNPAPAGNCRLLEIGCGPGANLLGMADSLPGSQFVGFDLSGVQIEMGRRLAKAASLENVTLLHVDARNTPDDLGLFDYVVCHGVYSWVPADVRSKLMQAFKQHLAPNGLVFVSYNTMPGWFSRGVIRQMMAYRVRRIDDPAKKVFRARDLLEFLSHCVPRDEEHYRSALKHEADLVRNMPDEYLYHEHLESNNNPLWFHEFVETAGQSGLQYFGDAVLSTMYAGNRPDQINKILQSMSDDFIEREQYLDFVVNRTFRRSLLCHAEQQLDRTVRPSVLKDGYLRSIAVLNSAFDIRESVPLEFSGRGGELFQASDVETKLLMQILTESKGVALPTGQIVRDAAERMKAAGMEPPSTESLFEDIANAALHLVFSGPIELSFRPVSSQQVVGNLPRVSLLNRVLAREQRFVINCFHRAVELDADLQRIVVMLDGNSDVESIVGEFARRHSAGQFKLPESPAGTTAGISAASFVDRKLNWLAQNGLLLG